MRIHVAHVVIPDSRADVISVKDHRPEHKVLSQSFRGLWQAGAVQTGVRVTCSQQYFLDRARSPYPGAAPLCY